MRGHMDFKNKKIRVSKLILDRENPRFSHLLMKDPKGLTEEEIQKEIEDDKETKKLLKSILRVGVTDPIWIQERNDGKFLVIEGNRRTTCLRMLLRGKQKCKDESVDYHFVQANVISEKADRKSVIIHKATLQTGKKEWGLYQEAHIIHQLEDEFLMEEEDIAAQLGKSIAAIKKTLRNYMDFSDYVTVTGDTDPKRFSYFQDAPSNTRAWYSSNKKNRHSYYSLITPVHGNQKIKSVSTKDGLRDFNKYVLTDETPLNYLLSDDTSTMKEAVDMAKEADLKKELGWIARIGILAQRIRGLDDIQKEKIRSSPDLRRQARNLVSAAKELEKALDE